MSRFLLIAPLLIWAVFVLGGGTILVLSRESGSARPDMVRAARDLPQNTLLSGPTVQPGFTGRYIVSTEGVKAGAEIKPENVGDAPIPPSGESTRLFLAVPATDLDAAVRLRVGSKQELCQQSSQNALASVTVQYVYCAGDPAKCSVTVEVPFDVMSGPNTSAFRDAAVAGSLRLASSCHL